MASPDRPRAPRRGAPAGPARLTVVLAVLTLPGCADAQTPVLLADGRGMDPAGDPSSLASNPAVLAASDAARTHWRSRDPSYEEELQVMAFAEGAFTRPGAEQTAVLYAMSFWPRCCPKMGLAVVEDGKVVANVAFEDPAHDVRGVQDLDGDGVDELVLVGSFGMGGQESTAMTLASFQGDGLVSRGTISIMETACAAGPGDGVSTAARISATPGPELVVERFQASCESGTWEAVGEAESMGLEASPENRFVALPVGR